MLKFSDFLREEILLEVVYDSLESSKPEETERHRKQYYNTEEDGIFHSLGGRYVLDRDRTDLHDSYRNGEQIKLTDIQSLPDNKGVLRYHGITEHGSAIPMSHFKKPPVGRAGKNQQKLEEEQIEYLSKAIEKAKKGQPFIRVKTANGTVHNVAGIKPAGAEGGWPKADAYLHDENENPVHWMSLKGDSFQQWGGYRGLDQHPALQRALDHFQNLKNKLSPNDKYLPPRSSFHYDLDTTDKDDRDLLLKSMYGIGHGGEHGVNNVHAIYSGNTIYLRENADGTHELNPNAMYVNRNDESSDLPGAKILVTNRSGLNQLGTGGRIMVSHAGNNVNSKNVVEFLRRKHPDERGSGEHGASTFSKPDDPSHLPNKLGIQQ